MKTIPLTKGKSALVDDEDFERVSQFKWHAVQKGHCWYARRSIQRNGEKSAQLMHSFVLGMRKELDHKDHDGLNNQKSNLRPATRSQNAANCRKFSGASQYKGVHLTNRKKNRSSPWRALMTHYGRRYHLGCYPTQEGAAAAYNRKAIELFGEFACLNPLPSA